MKCNLGQIAIDNVTMQEAVEAMVRMAQKSEFPRVVCTANLDHLATINRDQEFRSIYQNADFIVADGMPLVWLSKLTNNPLKERVAGSDLFWELGRASEVSKVKLFLLGGQAGTAARAAEVLRDRYPLVQIVGTYCPPFGTLNDRAELATIRSRIAQAEPDILLVGFGSPKQEKWIAANKGILGVPLLIGVGASFDMAAGVVVRAPSWLQKSGLEWMFRLVQEPTRLWKRYLGKDLPFLCWIVMVMVTERIFGSPSAKQVLDQSV
jgi:N-acetylglucosaminyldiphosphoundecaprenol N-acetyl-beta-D-mannosaminyltransferase